MFDTEDGSRRRFRQPFEDSDDCNRNRKSAEVGRDYNQMIATSGKRVSSLNKRLDEIKSLDCEDHGMTSDQMASPKVIDVTQEFSPIEHGPEAYAGGGAPPSTSDFG